MVQSDEELAVQNALMQDPEVKTPRKAWLMLAVIYLASIAAPFCQFKTPPLAPWLIPAFQLDAVGFGLQMSAIGIVGLILAFPAAYICRGLGAKNTVLLSVGCLAIGSFAGVLVNSFELLMVTRLLEGVGLGLIGVVGPTCVAVWFPERTRGIALGIWATWVPLAMVVIYAIAPAMAGALGWQSVFVFCAVFSLIAFMLVALIFRMPEGETGDFGAAGSFKDTLRLLKNGKLWVLGLVMLCFMFINTGALSTYYNTFLIEVHSYDPIAAAGMVSIFTFIGVFSTPLAGFISDKLSIPNKRWLVAVAFALYFLGLLVAWPDAGGIANVLIWSFVAVGGFATGFGAGTIRPLAPLVAGGGAMGAAVSMAVIQFAQNLGTAIGSPVFGAVMQSAGWGMANIVLLLPLCVIGAVLCIFLNPEKRSKKKD